MAAPELRLMPAILAFLGFDPRPKAKTIGAQSAQLARHREGLGWPQKRLATALHVNVTTLAGLPAGNGERGLLGAFMRNG